MIENITHRYVDIEALLILLQYTWDIVSNAARQKKWDRDTKNSPASSMAAVHEMAPVQLVVLNLRKLKSRSRKTKRN